MNLLKNLSNKEKWDWVLANQRLIKKALATTYINKNEFEECLNQAYIDAYDALKYYDDNKKIGTLVFNVVRQRACRNLSRIRSCVSIPIGFNDRVMAWRKQRKKYAKNVSDDVNLDEACKDFAYSKTNIELLERFLQKNGKAFSSDLDIYSDYVQSIGNKRTDTTYFENTFDRNQFVNYYKKYARNCLSPRERQVIEMGLGIGYDRGYTKPEITKVLGFSYSRTQQLESQAIRKIRRYINERQKFKID